MITADPVQICTSTKFYDVNGNLRQGTKGCEAYIPACEEDGAEACLANANYPAAKKEQLLPQNIRKGVSIAGIEGSIQPAPAACVRDGDKNCVASDDFPAAQKEQLADKVIAGATVAGVSGNVTLPATNHVLAANGAYGIGGNSLTPTLALPDSATAFASKSSRY